MDGGKAGRKGTRRKRDPDGTRESILEAAGVLLAKDGPEGLSVSQVAKLANVNRGTAYQHFQTREQLLVATTDWVSEKLCSAVFGGEPAPQDEHAGEVGAQHVIGRLVEFAMENPELGRVWLFSVLASPRPGSDPFWKQFKTRLDHFADSELAQPGIDTEVHSVMMLVSAFLWPVWARSHARSAKERQAMAEQYSREVLRLTLHGTMRPEKFPGLDAKLSKSAKVARPPK